MQQQKIIDNLFWFYQYKRECARFTALHRKYLAEFNGQTEEYFQAIESQSDKEFELSEKALNEIKSASVTLPKDTLNEYFKIIQEFLNGVYDSMDQEYAERLDSNGMDLAYPRGIPAIQNFIRAESDKQFTTNKKGKIEQFNNFKDLLNFPSDLPKYLDALRVKKPKPVIDSNNKYILGSRSKGSLAAWINSMKTVFYFKSQASNDDICRLVPTIILGVTIESRTLLNTSTRAYVDYYDRFSLLFV